MSGSTTSYIPFQPTSVAPFQFQAQLDNAQYTVTIPWNVYRAGWYISIATPSTSPVVFQALVASPDTYDISLTAGTFTSTIVFRESSGNFEVTS